jgi:hypothetical protein
VAARAAWPVITATLESNIYISGLQFGGAGARRLSMARLGKMRLDISDAILDETIGVLRDKFGWDGYRLHFARLELQKIANRVTPMQTVNVVDDPDDNRIIECALTAGRIKSMTKTMPYYGSGSMVVYQFEKPQVVRITERSFSSDQSSISEARRCGKAFEMICPESRSIRKRTITRESSSEDDLRSRELVTCDFHYASLAIHGTMIPCLPVQANHVITTLPRSPARS